MTARERLAADAARVDRALAELFTTKRRRADLYEAMEYSLLAGGKRLRPALVLEACRLCGGDVEAAMPLACAVEIIHTYSLIHDDLPSMDNDDLRRGKPTNHRVFGESTAILAGDALLTAAFETVLTAPLLSAHQLAEAGICLARAAGAEGMVAGQALDLAAQGRCVTRAEVEELQALKTGALITASVELGCIAAGAGEAQRQALRLFAGRFGLAFQMKDDILDVEGDESVLGKRTGSDAANQKTTFVSLLGREACRTEARQLSAEAAAALEHFPDAAYLQELAIQMVERDD